MLICHKEISWSGILICIKPFIAVPERTLAEILIFLIKNSFAGRRGKIAVLATDMLGSILYGMNHAVKFLYALYDLAQIILILFKNSKDHLQNKI